MPREEELKELRATAWQEFMLGRPDQVITTLDTLGSAGAGEIYGADLVQRVRKLLSSTHQMTVARR
ncbi:hypothetical protein ACGFX8_36775 [Streptomyces sp. NPDC048362]|uniref:hypothetical protein n=1 Tax=Streptomyces sp. NPDC048362 TaxID=3365539 RepID=UPI003724BB27